MLRQSLTTTAAGLAAGTLGSLLLGQYLQSLLFGVTARDPGILAGACATLLAVAVLATYIPGRRATLVDPLAALRDT